MGYTYMYLHPNLKLVGFVGFVGLGPKKCWAPADLSRHLPNTVVLHLPQSSVSQRAMAMAAVRYRWVIRVAKVVGSPQVPSNEV